MLPNTPVVFCDINSKTIESRKFPSDVTGISGVISYTQSINWLLQSRPFVKEIAIVHGVGDADKALLLPVNEIETYLQGRVKVTNLSNLPLDVIKRQVAILPKSAAVLYHLMFQDAAGNKYLPADVARELAAVSSVPVITGYDHFIGTGAIGGYTYSIDQQTKEAVKIGLRILRGESASNIPISSNLSNSFIFDYLALKRFDIPLSSLPDNSIVKNRPFSVWERYKIQLICIGAAFVVLVILLLLLAALTRRLKRNTISLNRLNMSLENMVEERTLVLNQTNIFLEKEIIERKKAEKELWEKNSALVESESRFRSLFHTLPNRS